MRAKLASKTKFYMGFKHLTFGPFIKKTLYTKQISFYLWVFISEENLCYSMFQIQDVGNMRTKRVLNIGNLEMHKEYGAMEDLIWLLLLSLIPPLWKPSANCLNCLQLHCRQSMQNNCKPATDKCNKYLISKSCGELKSRVLTFQTFIYHKGEGKDASFIELQHLWF